MWFVFISKWLLNSLFIIKSISDALSLSLASSHSQMFWVKMSIFHGFVTTSKNVCLRSVFVHFTDNICLRKTQTNALSLFSYRRVTFTQIFIKGPFLFYGVLSSDIIIIGLVESLNTWVQKKAATKEGSHYKNASLWCQNIGENGQAPGTASENI